MPAIIDQKTWNEAQQMKQKTGKHHENSPAEYLLTGKAFCGHCGSPMVGDCGTGKSGTVHYYYSCQSHKRRTGCAKKSLRKNDLEDKVISFLLDHCLTGEEAEKIADAVVSAEKAKAQSSPLESMRAELRSTDKKIANINNAIAEGIWASSTKVQLESLEETAKSLRESIAFLEYAHGQMIDRKRVLFFLERFRKLDRHSLADQRFLIRTFLNSVYVFDDHLKICINAVEGCLTVPLQDLPDVSPGSDIVCLGLLPATHPNTAVFCYAVAM